MSRVKKAAKVMAATGVAVAIVVALLVLLALLTLLTGCDRQSPATPVSGPSGHASASVPTSSRTPEQPTASTLPTPKVAPNLATVAGPPSAADLQAGAQLAAQGVAGTAACSSCHGPQGEGQQAGRFPRLAGLGSAYLRKQLDSYADGSRQHPVMQPIASALKADQRRLVAAHYASLDPLAPSIRSAPARPERSVAMVDSAAARLAWQGDERRQIAACANCHGRDGGGLGDRIPPLAGQPQGYLEDALAAWRDGRRRNDPSGQMQRIARALGEADAQAIAAWYAAQPMPASTSRQQAAFVSSLAPTTSGPTTSATATTGTGTEQGALSGGGVGPGGTGATQQQPPASRPQQQQ